MTSLPPILYQKSKGSYPFGKFRGRLPSGGRDSFHGVEVLRERGSVLLQILILKHDVEQEIQLVVVTIRGDEAIPLGHRQELNLLRSFRRALYLDKVAGGRLESLHKGFLGDDIKY